MTVAVSPKRDIFHDCQSGGFALPFSAVGLQRKMRAKDVDLALGGKSHRPRCHHGIMNVCSGSFECRDWHRRYWATGCNEKYNGAQIYVLGCYVGRDYHFVIPREEVVALGNILVDELREDLEQERRAIHGRYA